jgi:hypothetical protein
MQSSIKSFVGGPLDGKQRLVHGEPETLEYVEAVGMPPIPLGPPVTLPEGIEATRHGYVLVNGRYEHDA